MQKSSKAFEIVRIVVLLALTGLFLWLFYGEAIGDLPSDIPAHVRGALDPELASYSLVEPMLAFSFTYGGNVGVAVLLTMLQMATILLSERMMRALMPDMRREAVFALALVVNFTIAIYLPVIHPHFAKGVSTGNAWHNSTYTGMRLVSLGAIWAYLRFVGALESKSHMVDWVLFAVCVVVSGAMKPSFVVIFGPALVILCIRDLVRDGMSTLKRSLALSVPFFIVLGILVYQYIALYVEDTSSGIEFGLAKVWRHSHFFFPLGMIQSYAFPLIAFAVSWKECKGQRNTKLCLLMFLFALCIYLFINETGHRMYHGNFGWSLKIADYYLFIVAITVFFPHYRDKLAFMFMPAATGSEAGIPTGAGSPVAEAGQGEAAASGADTAVGVVEAAAECPRLKFWPEIFALLILSWHLLSGLAVVVKILMGKGYS